jgi:hypothetical protein
MAITKEIWENHVVENLYKNNEFMNASVNASQFVLNGKVVHIPQAGSPPNVEVNRTVLPATVTQRPDTEVTYTLESYTSDPILITNAESMELSYDKRESVIGDHEYIVKQKIADNLLVKWAPTAEGTILRTSGTSTASHLTNTTGNRKKITLADLKHAQLQLNRDNIVPHERYALMSADMYQQLTDEMQATQYSDFSKYYDAAKGILGFLYGFKILMRSSVCSYNNDTLPVVNPIGSSTDANDNDAVLCWQAGAVEHARGDVNFFQTEGSPIYYGDIYSLLIRMGGRKRRADNKGIVAIVQATA